MDQPIAIIADPSCRRISKHCHQRLEIQWLNTKGYGGLRLLCSVPWTAWRWGTWTCLGTDSISIRSSKNFKDVFLTTLAEQFQATICQFKRKYGVSNQAGLRSRFEQVEAACLCQASQKGISMEALQWAGVCQGMKRPFGQGAISEREGPGASWA